jgi:putative transposase
MRNFLLFDVLANNGDRRTTATAGEITQCAAITVSHSGGKWYASIQTLREVDPAVRTATTAIGIDLGIARFATLSDGSYIAPLNSFRKHAARLRRYQRAMSRKVKFSKNWQKAKRRVQSIHVRIGHARRDFLHKATRWCVSRI